MGSDRTFVFAPEGTGGGGGMSGLMAMIPSLLQGKGLDPNLVTALMSNRNNQDGFGGGCWWIWVILLFLIFGWGGNGFGGGFGNRSGSGLPSELNGDAGRELLMNAINGNGNAINQLASSLNCSTQQLQSAICNIQGGIDNVAGQVGLSSQQVINSVQNMSSQIGSQISSCCCNVLQSIERQGAESRLQNCQTTNTLTNTMNANTLSLRDGNLDNTRAIIAKLDAMEQRHCQEKIDALTAEKLALQGQISQSNQNGYFAATINSQIAPVANAISNLQREVDSIKCKMPPTVNVPWPQLRCYNPEVYSAAAYGAAAGEFAANSFGANGQCGC